MSNNGSDWLRLEKFAKSLLKRYADVYIVSGPLFLPQPGSQILSNGHAAVLSEELSEGSPLPAAAEIPAQLRKRVSYDVIGRHEVAVPTHLFKVIYATGGKRGETHRLSAFILPNGPLRGHPELDSFVVPLEEVCYRKSAE